MVLVAIDGSLRITNRNYTTELADRQSAEYLALFNELRPLVSTIFHLSIYPSEAIVLNLSVCTSVCS